MDFKLELVPIPVSDVDRAKAFYAEKARFNVDLDFSPGEGFRVVQLTPPGSACSRPPASTRWSSITAATDEARGARTRPAPTSTRARRARRCCANPA